MEFDGANGNPQAVSDFLVETMVKQFPKNFAFARTEVHRARKLSAHMEKFIGVFLDAIDHLAFRGNPHCVISRRVASNHTAQREQTCRASEGRFSIAAQFYVKARSSCAFLAKNQRLGILRLSVFWLDFAIPKKLLELLGFSKNGCTSWLRMEHRRASGI